jgi:hypothetical protein
VVPTFTPNIEGKKPPSVKAAPKLTVELRTEQPRQELISG